MNVYASTMGYNLQTAAEFAKKVSRLRKEFQGTWESPRSIYILSVKSEARSNHRAVANRTFPSQKFPSLIDEPLGYVYVGLTGLSVEDRFAVHQSKQGKASKIAKLGFLIDGSYEIVGKEITEAFGFKQVGWRDKKPEKLESWVAWNFYKMGYWVWGSHFHEEEDFLGIEPFE